jgi:hypothetical protein
MFGSEKGLTQQIAALTRLIEDQRADAARAAKKVDDLRQLVRVGARNLRSLERALSGSNLDVARERASRWFEKLAASGRPILVGPWYGEIGFETVYWAPFVRWAVLNHGIDPGRIAIVSRGGSGAIYGFDAPYTELFELVKPHKLRGLKTGQQKQEGVRSLDRQLAHEAAARLGWRRPSLLHPSLMYAALESALDNRVSADAAMAMLQPCTATPPPPAGLPPQYTAVRFYSSRAFPDTPENRDFAAAAVANLVDRSPVVLLRSSARFDDHGDLPVPPDPRVHVIDVGKDPATNVALQASVMAHSRLFVGTYGGGAYLAAVCGAPVLSVWSQPSWRRHHLSLALEIFQRTNGGRFSVASADELKSILSHTLAGTRSAVPHV